MKRICFAMVFVFCLLTCGTVCLAADTCGDSLFWEMDENGVLTIGGSGDMYDFAAVTDVPWYAVRRAVRSVVVEDGVTSVGRYAFYGCVELYSVSLPSGISRIGAFAFYQCRQLSDLAVPNGVSYLGEGAFCGCSALCDMMLPQGMTYVPRKAFDGCGSLASITVPDSIKAIGAFAFAGCDRLTDVYYTGTQAKWNAMKKAVQNEALTSAALHTGWTAQELITVRALTGGSADRTPVYDAAKQTVAGTLHIYLVNHSYRPVSLSGWLAVYQDGRLAGIAQITQTLDIGLNRVYFDDIAISDLASGDGLTAKLFLWDGTSPLTADLSVELF